MPGASLISSIDSISNSANVVAVIFVSPCRDSDISWVRRVFPTSFISILDPSSVDKPHYRLSVFNAGANQVVYDVDTLKSTLREDVILFDSGPYNCPFCGLAGLTEDQLWRHCPAYHINWPNETEQSCPLCQSFCREPLQVHIHMDHGPNRRVMSKEQVRVSKMPCQLYNFSLVVCRHPITGKFLLCQEFCNQGFWLPGGAVDGGEGPRDAAKRETLEEAGIAVDLKGILAIEYKPCVRERDDSSFIVRMRVVFYAEPTEQDLYKLPKSRPDFESAGACWCSAEDLLEGGLRLRGGEPRHWARYLARGGPIFPLEVLEERDC